MAKDPAAGRQSVPTYYDPTYSYGGLGVVPRRGYDPTTSNFLARINDTEAYEGVRQFAECAPMHLLRLLMEDAMATMALDNDLTIGFGQGFRIVAHKDYRDGRGTIDDDGTRELTNLWSKYDPSGGYAASLSEEGLQRIARHAAERINDTGEFFFEGVTDGRRGSGVIGIYDAEPLSFRYRDEKGTQKRILEQRQRNTATGWKPMLPTTLFTNAWRSSTDNPHGMPRCGAWLNRGLRKKAKERNLNDWMHAVAWPRIVVKFDIQKAVDFATQSLQREQTEPGYKSFLRGIGPGDADMDPYAWAQTQRERAQELMNLLNSSDILVADAAGDVDVLNAGNLSGLQEIWKMDRLEDAMSLLQLSHMLGINEGGALSTAAETMWNKYALSLSALRQCVAGPLCALGNLHFRAMGLDLIAVPDIEPVPPMDRAVFEAAEKARRDNLVEQCVMGVIGIDELAVKLSRTGAADKPALVQYIAAIRAQRGMGQSTNPAPGAVVKK